DAILYHGVFWLERPPPEMPGALLDFNQRDPPTSDLHLRLLHADRRVSTWPAPPRTDAAVRHLRLRIWRPPCEPFRRRLWLLFPYSNGDGHPHKRYAAR